MIYTIAAVLVLVLDQAVKFWTTKNIPLEAVGDQCVKLIPGVIHMTNVENSGAAFSILANQRWLLIAVSAAFIIAIIVLINMEVIRSPFGRWTAVLVAAGALGNCIDRVMLGYVVDMFEFEFFSFAVFNVADIFITVCGILFCLHVIIYRDPDAVAAEKPAKEPRQRRRRAPEPEEEEEDLPPARPVRRTRPSKPKEDPYANIPRRGEHKSLADELKLPDPDDPFAEWDFGGVVDEPAPAPRRAPRAEEAPAPKKAPRTEEAPARKRAPRTEEEAPASGRERRPARTQRPAAEESEPAAPKKAAAKPAPAPAQKPAAQPAPARKAPELELEEFSLEDILAEFRDT